MQQLLALPHHDGSALYVDNPHPALGESVTVRVRVPYPYPLRAVHVRSIRNGEQHIDAATIDRQDETETWWRAEILVHNPVTTYRFLLDGPDGQYAWLTASGVVTRDVTDAHDFWLTAFDPPPAWAPDAVVYQIFPDRFARSGAVRHLPDWAIAQRWYDDPVIYRGEAAGSQIYGGDLAGIQAHLDHIESLGFNTIYLTPFFEAPSNHRYNPSSFDDVDPLLGGNDALASLTGAAHARGMRVLGDITTNHTGDTHSWFQKGQADPTSTDAGVYYWREHPDYIAWLEVPTLPKLNWGSADLPGRLIDGPDSVAAKWMQPPYSLDGWRVDVANMTGRHERDDFTLSVARTLRATMTAENPESLLVAEHGHDYTRDIPGDGWHSTMNYAGFLRPLWQWVVAADGPLEDFFGLPVRVPRLDGARVVDSMREVTSSVSWQVTTTNFNLLGSHDRARIRTVTCDRAMAVMISGVLFTFPGIPMIFAGDEIGMIGVNGEDARRPFPWDRPETWDTVTMAAYRELIALRQAHDALRRGGMRWAHIGPDAIAYLRETPTERLLVSATRANGPAVRIPGQYLGMTSVDDTNVLYGGTPLTASDGLINLSGDGPAIRVWSLPQTPSPGRPQSCAI